jgi:hypothetical protein
MGITAFGPDFPASVRQEVATLPRDFEVQDCFRAGTLFRFMILRGAELSFTHNNPPMKKFLLASVTFSALAFVCGCSHTTVNPPATTTTAMPAPASTTTTTSQPATTTTTTTPTN